MHRRFRLSLMWALAVLLCMQGLAQEPEVEAPEELHMAPVRIDGTILFEVRDISFYTAERRADQVAQSIRQAAADRSIDPDTVALTPSKGRVAVACGKYRILDIVESEARQENLTLENYSLVVQGQISEAIRRYRHDCESAVLRDRGLKALAMAVCAALLLWLWFRLAVLLVAALLLYVFLYAILRLFPWTREFGDSILRPLVAPLQILFVGLVQQLPSLLFLAILFLVVRYVLCLIRAGFRSIESGGG